MAFGCAKLKTVNELARNLEQRYAGSRVSVSLDNRRTLSVAFYPFPAVVQSAPDREAAVRELAKTILTSAGADERIDTVEVANVPMPGATSAVAGVSPRAVKYSVTALRTP
jgi:hypothetical protein